MGNFAHMGIKRFLLALLIFLVVIGLLGFLFLQVGADDRLIKSLMPKIENRLEIAIEYDDVITSLTSVAFDNVRITPQNSDIPLILIKRMVVGFRVGPLLLGNLDLTGIRLEGLNVLIGHAADGADPAIWNKLVNKIFDKSASFGVSKKGIGSKPDIHLISGDILFDDGRFRIIVKGVSGRLSEKGKTLLKFESYQVIRAEHSLIFGKQGKLRYAVDDGVASLELDKPKFEIIADMDETTAILKDANQTLRSISNVNNNHERALANKSDEDNDVVPLMVSITEATGLIRGGPNNNINLQMNDISAEMSLNKSGLSVFRGGGNLPGTDAGWTLGFHRSLKNEPTITLEIPDLPLKEVGPLLCDIKYIDWADASVDGAITIVVHANEKKISVEGQTAVSGLTIKHNRIGPDSLDDLDVHLDFKTTYDRDNKSIYLERLLVSRGLARVTLRGTVHHDRLAFDLSANVPPTSCRQILGAVPPQLRKKLNETQLEGRFALDLRIAVDEKKPDKTVLETRLQNDCRIADWGTLPEPNNLRRPFVYMAYSPDGNRIRLTTGPGTNNWTPFSMISPYLLEAVLTTEDGKFEKHSGITIPEIRKAIEMNLKKGSFRHGASTITMQLAKNLFLSRDRTLSRKLQELFFTWYLETNFSKDELLELYFNVIEFGPSIYGITAAAQYYFGREPYLLNQIESVFLIKLLPNPLNRHSVYIKKTASERKINSLHRVLATMLARGRITSVEYQEALKQKLVFYHEGDPLPEPRSPVMRDVIDLAASNNSFDESNESTDESWIQQ